MPEAGLGPVVDSLIERDERHKGQSRVEIIEIIEALVLALVAVATSWSGYQAARWDGTRLQSYGEADRLKVEAETLSEMAGQERIYDNQTFDSWLRAKFDHKEELARFYEHRFRDEYQIAFAAWMKTQPFDRHDAPAGPMFMPEYRSAKLERSAALTNQAAAMFSRGTSSGETGDRYVRITVLLATVLLITAIGQRFRSRVVRIALMLLACALLCVPVVSLFVLPRI